MILYDSGFLGQDWQNVDMEWVSGDTEELYTKNLSTQPDDWYYKNRKIVYSYNSSGHRCKDIKDLDFDNYILFTGCSHTEGVGLELENTYPYLFSKTLNCDYYNLALSASGIDTLEYNLLHWFFQFKKKPKYVFIQWPDHSRFISLYPGYKHILPNGSWCVEESEKKFFVAGESTGFFNARKYISFNLIKNVVDVPIITVNLAALTQYNFSSLSWRKLDTARDLAHYGIKSHASLVDILKENLSDFVL